MLIQPELTREPQPAVVTVNGAGLIYWSDRARAGEVHIYQMYWKEKSTYELHLIWLTGRKLYRFNEKP